MKTYVAEVETSNYKKEKSKICNYNIYTSNNKNKLINKCKEFLKNNDYEIINEKDGSKDFHNDTYVIHGRNKDFTSFIHIWIEEIEMV